MKGYRSDPGNLLVAEVEKKLEARGSSTLFGLCFAGAITKASSSPPRCSITAGFVRNATNPFW